MKSKLLTIALFLGIHDISLAQRVIDLSSGKDTAALPANNTEFVMTDSISGNRTVLNVTKPSLTVYTPEKEKSNKTAIVICPGGAFHALDIDNEGYSVAKLLVAKGYTAIVLKYRLVHINMEAANPLAELGKLANDFKMLEKRMAPDVPLAIADGKAAIAYVKKNAAKLGINPAKVGIVGFSAGGTIAAAMAYSEDSQSRPAFSAPIYAYLAPFDRQAVPSNATPLFISVAADDDFKFDSNSAKLYQKWKNSGASAELHIYAKGHHGFGTKKQNLPVDHWFDRFTDWLSFLGFDR
ncbi:alpha/beta hydrolase [Dyadobacter bucti]|uniref:alpha/beta hydrolase n=1 Tax=Dyadobacter bucti TaxID=2572203 RepID=UPI001108DE52|nr:alpha/beta hydrolase [Dyadobacter bucti]